MFCNILKGKEKSCNLLTCWGGKEEKEAEETVRGRLSNL